MSAHKHNCRSARTMAYMWGSESALSFTVVGSGSELRTSVLAVSDFTCKAISSTPGVVWRKNREGKQEVMCLRGWRGH